MVEYAVLVGMIAIIALVALQVLGQKVSGTFSEVAEPLASD
jgi:Flp pilus assembly pilin Flp